MRTAQRRRSSVPLTTDKLCRFVSPQALRRQTPTNPKTRHVRLLLRQPLSTPCSSTSFSFSLLRSPRRRPLLSGLSSKALRSFGRSRAGRRALARAFRAFITVGSRLFIISTVWRRPPWYVSLLVVRTSHTTRPVGSWLWRPLRYSALPACGARARQPPTLARRSPTHLHLPFFVLHFVYRILSPTPARA